MCLPEAISHITRYSRSESRLCGGFSPPSASSVASFSAKAGLTYLPPPTTLRIAPVRSSLALPLLMYPAPPALNT